VTPNPVAFTSVGGGGGGGGGAGGYQGVPTPWKVYDTKISKISSIILYRYNYLETCTQESY
jgi:hypothetical protein